MYAAHIGRRIVALYNEHRNDGPPLSPREFFDEVVFPVFFDDETFLMWVNNSAFDQRYKQKKKTPLTEEVRQEALSQFHEDASELTEPYGHLYLGGTARELSATTSGQVTSLPTPVDADAVYLSWIGAAASIGVSGGLSLAIDEEDVLLALLDGWPMYRRYIQETDGLVGHQVESWNGWWLTERFGKRFDEKRPFRGFRENSPLKKRGKDMRLDTQDWVRVLFALARQFPEHTLTAYVFTFGNTNQTVGFRQLRLPEVKRFADLYIHLFGEADSINDPAELAGLYRTEFGFRTACRMGVIGLRTIQPYKLRDYIPSRGGGAKKKPKSPNTDNQRLTYHQYLTWIIAMLDNTDLITLAEKAAETLRKHAQSGTKGRATQKREAEQVLDTSGKRAFIEALTEIVEGKDEEDRESLDALVDAVVAMPANDVPLLLTLMRFKYHAQV